MGGEGKEDGLWREEMDENFAINKFSPNHVLSLLLQAVWQWI